MPTIEQPRKRAPGGGRKPKYDEPLEQAACRVPASICRKLEREYGSAGKGLVSLAIAWAKKIKT